LITDYWYPTKAPYEGKSSIWSHSSPFTWVNEGDAAYGLPEENELWLLVGLIPGTVRPRLEWDGAWKNEGGEGCNDDTSNDDEDKGDKEGEGGHLSNEMRGARQVELSKSEKCGGARWMERDGTDGSGSE